MITLLSKDHRITEKSMMEFQPFGTRRDRTRIRDMSGVVIKACVEYLEECASRTSGPDAGRHAAEELAHRLNERIPDRAYYVTADFMKNPWNSYSYEFSAFFAQFCVDISGDPQFHFTMGRRHAISPIIQALGRPFSIAQIYKLSPYFARVYHAKEVFYVDAVKVSNRSAILRMGYGDSAHQQFGPYLRGCAEHWCAATKGYFVGVPEIYRHLSPATVTDRSCMVAGDQYCEYEVRWSVKGDSDRAWPMMGQLARRVLHKEIEQREKVIDEQLRSLDSWQEELKEAYVQQQQLTVELQRRVEQLTTLHESGLVFASILDRDTLIEKVLDTVTEKLRYDRGMICLFDPERKISYDARVRGVTKEVADFARSLEIPVTDPDSLEGTVLLKGEPVLEGDIQQVWDRLHPLNQELARVTKAKSIMSVPLKVKSQVLGSLTVDRTREEILTQEDLNLVGTLASQVAIALDNTNAYRQIEELIAGLEAKVRERTAELELANERLREMDQLKSKFLSHVSHELRTPLTSIKGFIENLLSGLVGPLAEKQAGYLARVQVNADRLIRMITDLLERSRIEAGKLDLSPAEVDLRKSVTDAVEQLRPLAVAKRQQLEVRHPDNDLMVWADSDRLFQILTNLIHNAIKFTPEAGHIAVEVDRHGTHFAVVTVVDTGPGIPAEAQAKIFDPFYRISQDRRDMGKGLGLGLSIVKTLVELHGGVISVQSKPGGGSAFLFTLPLKPTFPRLSGSVTAGVKRLLVVDDDPDIREFLVDRLESFGYTVETAVDGHTALLALQAQPFDGLVLDIGMPEVDGLEVLRQMRTCGHAIPVIMVTASGSKERAIQAVNMGAQAYLLKPFDAEALKDLVCRWFGPPER